MLVKWIKVAYGYAEKYGVPHMKPQEREQFREFTGRVLPLLREAEETTRKMLLPALADGQIGLVFDAKLMSKKYQAAMPASAKPLAMLEPALVLGVSDAPLLEQAIARYWKIANGLLDAWQQIPDLKRDANIPKGLKDFKIPVAEKTQIAQGTMYSYALPKPWGVDHRILPNAGLSNNVAVLTISRAICATLAGRAAADRRPLVGDRSSFVRRRGVNFAGLVDAVAPWVDYALDQAAAENPRAPIATIRDQNPHRARRAQGLPGRYVRELSGGQGAGDPRPGGSEGRGLTWPKRRRSR